MADRILTKVSTAVESIGTIELRLYGGWDRNNRLTKLGQDLSAQMRSLFPKNLKIKEVPVRMTMQLAESLEALPTKRLLNTVRSEPLRRIKSQMPSKITCRNDSCPIDPMAIFLNTERCPAQGCIAEPKMLLSRDEQKLVDTMIVADLIYLASNGQSTIGLVSSDDDMWPGILSALNLGAHVVHLQTRVLQAQSPYLTTTLGTYTPIGL
jgi:hypothetical protein